jgi:hypothetical protein
LNPSVAGAMEPKVAGAAFGVAKGKLSNPVEGGTGICSDQKIRNCKQTTWRS